MALPGVMRHRAFTLIELLLILVILSVVLGLSLPNFKHAHEGLALRSGADTVVYAMRYARSRSVAENFIVTMVFEAGSFQLKDVPGRMGRRVALPSGVHFKEAPGQIIFYPDGQIDPARFFVAGEKSAFIISTREIPGHVVLLEEAPDAKN